MAESAGQAASEPLLTSVQPQNGDPLDVEVSQGDDSVLDHTLRRLDFFLFLFGFHQTSLLSAFMSWAAFLLVGVSIPVLTLELSECSGCEEYQIIKFELSILASQASLAAVSLLCVSHNLRKYGVRKFLFVDRFHGQMSRFRKEYVQKIQVSSIVEVVGLILCLHAAAKISHRAQGVASVACRWHALVTCSSDGSQHRPTNSVGNSEANLAASFLIDCSESDLESLDNASWSTNTYFTSHMSSFQKRQALVMYLQSNPGGLTIFGWTVDRTLINTIFFIELSLVLFVLGKTVVFIS